MVNLFSAMSFVLARKIENEASPIYQNTIRAILGVIVFSMICLFSGVFLNILLISWQLWLILGASVIFNVVLGDTICLLAQKKLNPARALAVTTTSPFFTIFFATMFLNRSFSLDLIISSVLVGSGVIIIVNSKSTSIKNEESESTQERNKRARDLESFKGGFLALLTALFWAIGTVLTDYSMNEVTETLDIGLLSAFVALSIRYMFASSILSVIAFTRPKNRTHPTTYHAWAVLILSACFGTIIGALLFVEAARIAGASILSIITTSLPLFAIPFSYLINKEKISKLGLLGVVITILGVLILLL